MRSVATMGTSGQRNEGAALADRRLRCRPVHPGATHHDESHRSRRRPAEYRHDAARPAGRRCGPPAGFAVPPVVRVLDGRRRCAWTGRGRAVGNERRIVVPDPRRQLLQLAAGLDIQLASERGLCVAVGEQRLRPLAGAGEREHQARPQLLAVRRLADRLAEVGDEGIGLPEPEPDPDELVDSRRPDLLQALDLGRRRRLAAHLGDVRPAPQGEGLGQPGGRVLRLGV